MLDFLQEHIWTILILLNYILSISAAFTVLLKNINPTKTISYIFALVFFPFFGLLIYYLFGQEYRKDKIFNRKAVLNQSSIKRINKELERAEEETIELESANLKSKAKLIRLLSNSSTSPLTRKNKITLLRNGEVKFKHLLKDLKNAQDHIHLEYYILKDDDIGSQILEALCERAKSGVVVRISKDDVGSKLSSSVKRKLEKSGVEFYPFMPVLFTKFTGKMNYRDHRKIVIIDGEIGYVGGINIGDEYNNTEDSKHYWRDTHLRIEGEAVRQLQIHFLMNWNFVSEKELKIRKEFFPKIECEEDLSIQIAASGPDTDWAYIMEAMLTAISTAEDYIYITTPYFIPNPEIITALQIASRSGVEVKLIIPKKSDSWTAKHATGSYLQGLLESGIDIHRYTKGFIHAKTIVVDDVFSTVGTSNMDYRSFNINFEINALIYNEDFSKQLKQHFIEDLKECDKVIQEDWENRSKLDKLKESYSRLWAPLL